VIDEQEAQDRARKKHEPEGSNEEEGVAPSPYRARVRPAPGSATGLHRRRHSRVRVPDHQSNSSMDVSLHTVGPRGSVSARPVAP
jgi:hypothetical protein